MKTQEKIEIQNLSNIIIEQLNEDIYLIKKNRYALDNYDKGVYCNYNSVIDLLNMKQNVSVFTLNNGVILNWKYEKGLRN